MNAHVTMYRRLLRLYPAAVQHEFAGEMSLVFADSIAHARKQGAAAIFMTWLRELRSLPATLLQSHGNGRHLDRKTLFIAAFALFNVSMFSSRIVANLGLFHTISWVLLAASLIAGGMFLGAGMRRTAGVMLLFAVLAPLLLDRALLRTLETRQSIAAPGVRADAYLAPTDAAAKSFLDRMKESKTPRLRTTARWQNDRIIVTSVRSGGVDGAYFALAMLLLIGSAAAGRRIATAT